MARPISLAVLAGYEAKVETIGSELFTIVHSPPGGSALTH